MAIPTNLDPETALPLTLGVTTQRVDEAGTTYAVWYRYDNVSGHDEVLSMWCTGGNLTPAAGYKPYSEIYNSLDLERFYSQQYKNGAVVFAVLTDESVWLNFRVYDPGVPANLTITLMEEATFGQAPGHILINSASMLWWSYQPENIYKGLQAAIIDGATESFVGFIPQMPTGEHGDITTDGRVWLIDESTSWDALDAPTDPYAYYCYQFAPDLTTVLHRVEIHSHVLPPRCRMHRPTDTLYVIGVNGAYDGGDFYQTLSADGVLGTPHFFGHNTVGDPYYNYSFISHAVNNAQTVMWVGLTTYGSMRLGRFDMVAGDFIDPPLYTLPTHDTRCEDMVILADDSVICAFQTFVSGAGDPVYIRRYAQDGTLLSHWDLTFRSGSGGHSSIAVRLADSAQPDAFWVFCHTVDGYSDIRKMKSDGTVLYSFELPDVNQMAIEDLTPPTPWSSDSCPIIELRDFGAPLPPPPSDDKWFTGFEGGTLAEFDTGVDDFHTIDDRRSAPGGRWYLKHFLRGDSAVAQRLSHALVPVGVFADLVTRCIGRIACHVRILQCPFQDQSWAPMFSFDDPDGNIIARLDLGNDYSIRHGLDTNPGPATRPVFQPGDVYYLRYEVSYWPGAPCTVTSVVRVFDRTGLRELFSDIRLIPSPVTAFRLGQPSIGSSLGIASSIDMDVDNYWIAAVEVPPFAVDPAPFPVEIFVQPLWPTGTAGTPDWTGDWRYLRDIPLQPNTPELVASTDTAVLDLIHEPASSLGLIDGTPTSISVPFTEFVHKNLYDGSILPPADFIVYPWAGASQMVGLRGLYGTCIKVRDGKRYESWLTPVHGVDASSNPYNIWARAMAHMPADGSVVDFNRCYYFNCGTENTPTGWFNPHITYQNLRSLVPDTTKVVARFKEGTWSLSDPNRWLGTPPGAPGPPTHESWFFGDDDGVNYLETRTGSTEVPVASPVVVTAVKVSCAMKQSSGTSIQQLRIGTTGYPIDVTSAYPTTASRQYAIEWLPRTLADVDALTYGVRSSDTNVKQLGNIWGEFLCDGELPIVGVTASSYRHIVSSYLGDGTWRTVNVGFRPDMVLLLKMSGGATGPGAYRSWFRSSGRQPGTTSFNYEALGLIELTANGFSISPLNSVNEPAAIYVYLAIRDGGSQAGGSYLLPDWATRNFAGTSVQSARRRRLTPALNSPNYLPDWLWGLMGSTINSLAYVEGESAQMAAVANPVAAGIVATSANPPAFDLGDTFIGTPERNDVMVYRRDGWIPYHFDRGRFSGTGSQVNITSLLFTPALVVVVDSLGNAYWRSLPHGGSDSTLWGTNIMAPDKVVAIIPHGFSVHPNLVTTGELAWWFAWDPQAAANPEEPWGRRDPPVGPPGWPGEGTICAGGGLKIQPGPQAGSNGCTSC